MRYERRVVDKERNIIQITTEDERFYALEENGVIYYIPSTTWVTSFYPKGKNFEKYLVAQPDWETMQARLIDAGEKGTYQHKGCEHLLQGKTLNFDTAIEAQGGARELTAEEYLGVMSFVDWYKATKPKTIKTEHTVFAPEKTHAGTIDYICEIDKEPWIIDFKTSPSIYPSYECQLTAYRIALGIEARLGILQLGYKYNKNKKWKFTEIEFQPDLWEACYKIWQKECAGIHPLQREYPLSLSLKEDDDVKTAKRR